MRSREEIERAIETISSIWDKAIFEHDKGVQHSTQAAIQALQWVLEIPEGDYFEALLFKLDKRLHSLWQSSIQ